MKKPKLSHEERHRKKEERKGKNHIRQWSDKPAPAVNSRSLIHVFNCSNLLLILNTAARMLPSCASIPSLRPSKGERKVRTKKETWQPNIHNCYFGAAFLDLVCRCFRSMILVQFVWFGSLEVGGGRNCTFPMKDDYLFLRNLRSSEESLLLIISASTFW